MRTEFILDENLVLVVCY